ncbi:MAG: hypothetical protein JWO75_1937 [Actinomycetia bacterium]|nr:hypothetical protein [Actinomycetes bacterium]
MIGGLFYFVVMMRWFAGCFPAVTRGHALRAAGGPRGTGGPQGTGPATGRQAGAGITSRTQTAANADLLPAGPYRDHNDPRSLKPQSRRESRAVCIRLSSTFRPDKPDIS